MRLDDNLTTQMEDLIKWFETLAATDPPAEQIFREIAQSAREHALVLREIYLPKLVNPTLHWNPNGAEQLGNGAPKIAEFIRASGPKSEALMNGDEAPSVEGEGVSPAFELPARGR